MKTVPEGAEKEQRLAGREGCVDSSAHSTFLRVSSAPRQARSLSSFLLLVPLMGSQRYEPLTRGGRVLPAANDLPPEDPSSRSA